MPNIESVPAGEDGNGTRGAVCIMCVRSLYSARYKYLVLTCERGEWLVRRTADIAVESW